MKKFSKQVRATALDVALACVQSAENEAGGKCRLIAGQRGPLVVEVLEAMLAECRKPVARAVRPRRKS